MGFIVWTSITAAATPFSFRDAAALIASGTINPQAKIATSLPSAMTLAFPSLYSKP